MVVRLALEDIPRHHDFGHADKALSKQLIKVRSLAALISGV